MTEEERTLFRATYDELAAKEVRTAAEGRLMQILAEQLGISVVVKSVRRERLHSTPPLRADAPPLYKPRELVNAERFTDEELQAIKDLRSRGRGAGS